jgi:hypothetical protein
MRGLASTFCSYHIRRFRFHRTRSDCGSGVGVAHRGREQRHANTAV